MWKGTCVINFHKFARSLVKSLYYVNVDLSQVFNLLLFWLQKSLSNARSRQQFHFTSQKTLKAGISFGWEQEYLGQDSQDIQVKN